MNDGWNGLNARLVDVGDKLDGGSTEWRQLFLDLQEIVDWIERAIQELEAQKPVGSDIDAVNVQNDAHQVNNLEYICEFVTVSPPQINLALTLVQPQLLGQVKLC